MSAITHAASRVFWRGGLEGGSSSWFGVTGVAGNVWKIHNIYNIGSSGSENTVRYGVGSQGLSFVENWHDLWGCQVRGALMALTRRRKIRLTKER